MWGGTGWYSVVLGQCRPLLVDTWWYWVSVGRYWFVLGGTGSVWDGTGWYLVVLSRYYLILLGIKGWLHDKSCSSFGFFPNEGRGEGPAQIFCHLFMNAFWVNKRSLFPPKCQSF